MASYEVVFRPSVHKDLRRLPHSYVVRIMAKIEGLAEDPLPDGAIQLSDTDRLYRLRVGDYRVIYEVHVQEQQLIVLYVRHRRDAYRGL